MSGRTRTAFGLGLFSPATEATAPSLSVQPSSPSITRFLHLGCLEHELFPGLGEPQEFSLLLLFGGSFSALVAASHTGTNQNSSDVSSGTHYTSQELSAVIPFLVLSPENSSSGFPKVQLSPPLREMARLCLGSPCRSCSLEAPRAVGWSYCETHLICSPSMFCVAYCLMSENCFTYFVCSVIVAVYGGR